MVYTLSFFSSKCSLFHNSNVFGSYVIHILYTGCAKIKKKKFRRQKVNIEKILRKKKGQILKLQPVLTSVTKFNEALCISYA